MRIAGGRLRMDTPCPYSPTLPPLAFGHLPLTGGVGPRSPITGVTPWVRQRISGAQNLSSNLNSRRPTGAFVVADFVSLASPDWAKLAHSIAPPLQRKPAALGFALGAACGGLFGWKIAAGAVSVSRLALPSRWRSVRSRRAGLGPAPTKGQDASTHAVGAAHRAARERPDEGIGPYEKNATTPVSAVSRRTT